MRGGGVGKKMSVFVHAQGIKTVHAGGSKKGQNSVHVVVECPLTSDVVTSRQKLGIILENKGA